MICLSLRLNGRLFCFIDEADVENLGLEPADPTTTTAYSCSHHHAVQLKVYSLL